MDYAVTPILPSVILRVIGAVTIGDPIYIPAGGPLNGGTVQTNGNQAFALK